MAKNTKKKLPVISKNTLLYGGYSTALIIVVLAVVILINVGITALNDTFSLDIDMTSNRLYTISSTSKEMVSNLEDDIYVYTLFQTGYPDTTVNEILNRFQGQNPSKFHVENVDPIQNPGFVQNFQREGESIATGSIIVTDAERKAWRVFSQTDLYDTELDSSSYSYTITGVNVETRVVSAILYLTTDDIPQVYILQGHGEPSTTDFPYISTLLTDQNYDVKTLNLRTSDTELTADDTLIIYCPSSDLDETERETLIDWLESGAKCFICLNPVADELPNFLSLMDLFGITTYDGLVVENTRENYYTGMPSWLIPNYGEHEINDTLSANSMNILIPAAGAIKLPTKAPNSSYEITELLSTSDEAYITTDYESEVLSQKEDDPTGKFSLAATVLAYEGEERETRLVCMNNYSTLVIAYNEYPYGNEDFFLNCMNWLVGETEDIYIRTKSINSTMLYFENASQLYFTLIMVWPAVVVIMLAAAFVIYRKRKHL